MNKIAVAKLQKVWESAKESVLKMEETEKSLQGKRLRVTGRKPAGNRDKGGTYASRAYTQTIVRLYANDRVPIPDLKRLFL